MILFCIPFDQILPLAWRANLEELPTPVKLHRNLDFLPEDFLSHNSKVIHTHLNKAIRIHLNKALHIHLSKVIPIHLNKAILNKATPIISRVATATCRTTTILSVEEEISISRKNLSVWLL